MKKIQVYSPHQDDISLFMGGTFLKHYHDQDQLQIILMTGGEKGTKNKLLQGAKIRAVRNAEMEKLYKENFGLNFTKLNFIDGQLNANEKSITKVLECIEHFQPNIIYTPESTLQHSFYSHPDHLTTGFIIETALKEYEHPVEVRYYHSKSYNLLVDISEYFKKSQSELRYYHSQDQWSAPFPFLIHLGKFIRWVRCHWWGWKKGCQFAEAFRCQNFDAA